MHRTYTLRKFAMTTENNEENIVSGSRENESPLVIAVEGNLGSGKTTFLEHCSLKPGIDVNPEPIAAWRNVNGENLLAKFYENPRRYGMAFQLQTGLMLRDTYKTSSWRPLKLVERSLLSSRHCFLEHLRQTGTIEPVEFSVMSGWYDRVETEWRARPHAIVYLRTTPEEALRRVIQRSRVEERNVGLQHITELHQLHETWLDQVQAANVAGDQDMPIYTIDADLPIDQIYHEYQACIHFLDLLNA